MALKRRFRTGARAIAAAERLPVVLARLDQLAHQPRVRCRRRAPQRLRKTSFRFSTAPKCGPGNAQTL